MPTIGTTVVRREATLDPPAADHGTGGLTYLSATAARAAVPSLAIVIMMASASLTLARMPDTIAARDQVPIVTVHGEGAQIYQCKADAAGRLAWHFHEPIAILLLNGKTLGRHYAGPTWAFDDGSAITGKITASEPGATRRDIPWLRLDVIAHSGAGQLSAATTVQRINTNGGAMTEACRRPGTFRSVPYSADYVFLRKR